MSTMDRIPPYNKNTIVTETSNGMTVTLHGTAIVWWDSDTIRLRTGGYRTVTTKTRMNQVSNEFGLGYHVHQSKGEWYVTFAGGQRKFEGDHHTLDRTHFVPFPPGKEALANEILNSVLRDQLRLDRKILADLYEESGDDATAKRIRNPKVRLCHGANGVRFYP